ncbi:unnamed protein product [Heligmosomoides polygyrus]|uniref:MSP domain-containing protein n=1 Tax=Heligmosomoides polygyrus TaxID=6339 RepID=A0A183F1V5_HELPZ|nr:unnamed protein product [Heligmosomoides polygyrus]
MPSSVTPSDAYAPAGGEQTMHQIQLGSEDDVQVKWNNTDDYRAPPAFGFVDASSNANIVIRNSGAPRSDSLVVQHVPAPQNATDVRAAFGIVQNVPNEGMFTVNLNAS